MNEIKDKITQWWLAGCDYDSGVAMYLIHGKNQVLKNCFPRRKLKYFDKLRYQLCKDVGLDWLKMPPFTKTSPVAFTVALKKVDESKLSEPLPVNDSQYPKEVRRVIYEYSEAYKDRSMLHSEMAQLTDNSEDSCNKRSAYLSRIKKLSERMNFLYAARKAYEETKQLPNIALLWPKEIQQIQLADDLPNDIDVLKSMKKNIQVSMVKDRNMLNYQQVTKGSVNRPMPSGPKRMEIEKRIQSKLKRIEEIEFKIVNLQ